MRHLKCSATTKRKAIKHSSLVGLTVMALVGWLVFLLAFGVINNQPRPKEDNWNVTLSRLTTSSCANITALELDNFCLVHLSHTAMIPHWFVSFLLPAHMITLILDLIKEHWLLKAIHNLTRAMYIFCCGSSLYFFGALASTCYVLSYIGFAGILISAMSVITTSVLDPTKNLCTKSIPAATFYTKRMASVEDVCSRKNDIYSVSLELTEGNDKGQDTGSVDDIHTQRNEVYGVSMELTEKVNEDQENGDSIYEVV